MSVPLVSTTSDRGLPASCAARWTRLVFPLAVGPTRMGIQPLSMQWSMDSSRPCWEASSCSCSLCGRGAAVLPAHEQGPTVYTAWLRWIMQALLQQGRSSVACTRKHSPPSAGKDAGLLWKQHATPKWRCTMGSS